MLHVRLVSPAALTGRLTERLATAPGVQNVVVQAGAARPGGDAVQSDVADEAANPVFAGTPVPFPVRRPAGGRLHQPPDVFSVIVAVLAGIVGVVSLTEARANALIGVFISVTTSPAASSVGISIAFASWTEAAGSALQLLLNVGVLIVVGAACLIAQRGIWSWRSSRS